MTSLTSEKMGSTGNLYEELYCERGNMENRIKEQFQSVPPTGSARRRFEPIRYPCTRIRQWRISWSAVCAAWG